MELNAASSGGLHIKSVKPTHLNSAYYPVQLNGPNFRDKHSRIWSLTLTVVLLKLCEMHNVERCSLLLLCHLGWLGLAQVY